MSKIGIYVKKFRWFYGPNGQSFQSDPSPTQNNRWLSRLHILRCNFNPTMKILLLRHRYCSKNWNENLIGPSIFKNSSNFIVPGNGGYYYRVCNKVIAINGRQLASLKRGLRIYNKMWRRLICSNNGHFIWRCFQWWLVNHLFIEDEITHALRQQETFLLSYGELKKKETKKGATDFFKEKFLLTTN